MSEDVLSGLLRRIRLRGALFFHVECAGTWVIEAPASVLISGTVLPASEHLMEYHVVLHGTCWAGITGEPSFEMNAGDVILFPHGDAHVMSCAPGLRAEPDLPFLIANLKRRAGLPFMVHQQDNKRVRPATPHDETDISSQLPRCCAAFWDAISAPSILCSRHYHGLSMLGPASCLKTAGPASWPGLRKPNLARDGLVVKPFWNG